MKNLRIQIFITLITFVTLAGLTAFTQGRSNHLDLVFAKGQTELSEEQKIQIQEFLKKIKNGDDLAIYPLTFHEASQEHYYAKIARSQAASIEKYARSIGLIYVGTPANFPSTYRGVSVRVNLTYLVEETHIPIVLANPFPKKPSQFFIIDPTKDTVLIGEEGTVLHIAAGSLMSDKKVEFELTEYYSLGDYVKGGLATSSNGTFIETGGTLYLNAKEKESGRPVRVNKEKGIDIEFTKGKDNPNMQLFVPERGTEGNINWVLPSSRTRVRKGSWKMTEVIMDAEGNIIDEKVFTSRKEWEAYLAKKKAARDRQADFDSILASDEGQKNSLDAKLTAYDLGYINCDAFPDTPMEQMIVSADQDRPAHYYLVFNDIRGVMKGSSDGNYVHFSQVPAHRDATILAFVEEDGQFYFFKSGVVTGRRAKLDIQLKAENEEFVNQQLAMIK